MISPRPTRIPCRTACGGIPTARPPTPFLTQLLACLLLAIAFLGLGGGPAHAQPGGSSSGNGSSTQAQTGNDDDGNPVDTPMPPSVDVLRKQLDAIPQKLAEDDDGRKLLGEVNAIGTAAEQLATSRAADLADIDSRLAGLGPAPEKGAQADSPDVAAQRAALTKQRAAVDAELKLARLIMVDAEQRGADLIRQRREQFQAALTHRIDSPLGRVFWRNLRNALPGDAVRLESLANEVRTAVRAAMQSESRGTFLASLAGALLLAVAGTWLAERLLIRLVPSRLPGGRLRRSLLAAASVLVHTLLIGLAAQWFWSALEAGAPLSDSVESLADSSVRSAVFAAVLISLGHALLLRKRSSWRLTGISDGLATRLSPYPWCIGIVAALSALVTDINSIIGASLAAEVSVHVVSALLVAALMALALRHLRTPSAPAAAPAAGDADGGNAADADAPAAEPRPVWVGLVVACANLATLAIALMVAVGYVALAGTLARQMVWTGVVFATTYLAFQVVDDVCEALLSSKSGFGGRLHRGLGVDANLLDQVAVVTSGVLRVALFFYMVIALLAPFGTGPDEVFRRGTNADHSLKVGSVVIAPQAMFTAMAVLLAGFLTIRVFKRWLSDRYFPSTSLEPGMRSSITTLLGYVGGVVVIAVALAGLGISVERIAWVASALSVGIGFGLQAIVQNFISGLILLAERPVKVGDWVVLGTTEGDVRRVNVRATEIQLGDRSTVIVPNSEFITKTVRNMTLTGAPGRVLLRLPAPLDVDARRMGDLILAAFTAHEGILDNPAPVVQLEDIVSGTLTFLAIGYVSNPRNAGGVKSELLFSILESLREAGMALSPPASTSVPPPTMASAQALPTVAIPQPKGPAGDPTPDAT
jgi:potassium-dependent mechanosensitive channel